ncbi:MAG: isoprenylcysteine carboxylmethyltransferase family protein [Candidatus Thorarchaeota archaeon]|nr:isoprenylcysteine carboxylmethyltransferase family protein [Candidatus Thorarchaeota archaeon]
MEIWPVLSVLGMFLSIPILFKSYEHENLRARFGQERGDQLAERLGLISGYLYFGFWIMQWLVPQEPFNLGIVQGIILVLPLCGLVTLSIPIDHLIIGVLCIAPGAWLGIVGVRRVTLRVAERHRPEKIVSNGIYAHVRHPQYLRGILSHLGMTFFLSALGSLLLTPIVIIINYIIARKEEIELVREFGEEYEEYRRQVPMFLPRL